jgi:hypothetical protein
VLAALATHTEVYAIPTAEGRRHCLTSKTRHTPVSRVIYQLFLLACDVQHRLNSHNPQAPTLKETANNRIVSVTGVLVSVTGMIVSVTDTTLMLLLHTVMPPTPASLL